jgi:hypothetical protein
MRKRRLTPFGFDSVWFLTLRLVLTPFGLVMIPSAINTGTTFGPKCFNPSVSRGV